MRRKAPVEPDPAANVDRWLAGLLLLPGALLVVPWFGAPGRGDPFPALTGTGALALSIVPALVLAAARGARPRTPGLALLLVPLGVAALALFATDLTDTMEADRAALLLAAALGATLAGAALGEAGRALFARGLVLLSIAWTAFALAAPLFTDEPQPVGALGNTGSLSQAALPGAAAGVWLAARGGGPWRVAGALAAVLFAVHAGVAPVRAGGLAMLVACAAAFLRARRAAFAVGAVLGGLALLLGPLLGGGSTEPEPAGEAASGGGAKARLLVWDRLANLTFDHIALGIGPGQVQARFPPYRAAEEIELSSHGRALGDVEVEHPHSDWLAGFPEFGFLGGALWMLFLAFLVRAAWRRMANADPLALATLAVLVGAFFHAPLLRNPASSPLAFALFGALLVDVKRAPATQAWRHLPWLPTAALLVAAPRAWSLVAHGRALAQRTDVVATYDAAQQRGTLDAAGRRLLWEREGEALTRALDARPDSHAARMLEARRTRADPARRAESRLHVEHALMLRPRSVAALLVRGELAALDGDFETARGAWERVLELDGAHPIARAHLEQVARDEGLALLLAGEPEAGLALLATEVPRLAGASPDLLHAMAAEHRQGGDERAADALECAANLLWAREHTAAGRNGDAVRLLRQALNRSARHVEGGAPAIRAELDRAQGD